MQDWEQAYQQSIAFCGAANRRSSPKAIEESWHRAFSCAAKSLGFNKAAREILWESLAAGNWTRLHPTDEERTRTVGEWLEVLHAEVWNCSDQWTLDRLMRCHWTFRQYMYAVQKEAGVEV